MHCGLQLKTYGMTMKLKQRACLATIVSTAIFLMCVISLAQYVINYRRDKAPFLKPELKDFQTHNDHAVADDAGTAGNGYRASARRLPRQPRVQAPVKGLDDNDDTLQVLRNHLPHIRRELDVSNHNSNSNLQGDIGNDGDTDAARKALLEDPVIKDNADTIIEIAHMLEDKQDAPANSNRNSRTSSKVTPKRRAPGYNLSNRYNQSSPNIATANQIQIAPAFRYFNVVLHEDVVLQKYELPDSIVRQFDRFDKYFFVGVCSLINMMQLGWLVTVTSSNVKNVSVHACLTCERVAGTHARIM